MVIGGVATFVLFLAVVIVLARTGGARAVSDNAAVIGALVALGGVLTAQMVSVALEDRRSQEARELEAQRAHEDALQNYVQQVGKLLIEQPLLSASPGDNLSTVVRVQTLAVLAGLEPERKRILLQFLYESGLISEHKLIVGLEGADLSEADLSGARLSEADLSKANLSEADLSWARLSGVNLSGARLSEADLSGAILLYANLRSEARLREADLSGADLRRADLSWATLWGADLSGAILLYANLSGANLSGANLSEANLSEADLSGARLSGVNLRDEVTDVQMTNAQIAVADSLRDATMPNGQKYEDWIKSKDQEKNQKSDSSP